MDYQVLFNLALSAVVTLGGWVYRSVCEKIQEAYDENEELRKSLRQLELKLAENYYHKSDTDATMQKILIKVDRIESLEVQLARHYVRKDEFAKALDNLSMKLDRLFEQLSNKADR